MDLHERALAGPASDLEPAAVAPDDMLDDGEAEAGTADRAAPAGIDAVEAFGEPRNVLGRDALALIDHRQPDEISIGRLESNADLRAGAAVSDGVDQQIVEELGELRPITDHHGIDGLILDHQLRS